MSVLPVVGSKVPAVYVGKVALDSVGLRVGPSCLRLDPEETLPALLDERSVMSGVDLGVNPPTLIMETTMIQCSYILVAYGYLQVYITQMYDEVSHKYRNSHKYKNVNKCKTNSPTNVRKIKTNMHDNCFYKYIKRYNIDNNNFIHKSNRIVSLTFTGFTSRNLSFMGG